MLREKQGRRKASAGSRDAKRKARKPFNFNRERKRKDEQIMWAHERKGDRIATDGRTTDERAGDCIVSAHIKNYAHPLI